MLTNKDAKTIAGMVKRGDKDHDIAAWFGENQGRIAEAKKGEYGPFTPDPNEVLPPKGSPGIKARRLRGSVKNAIKALENDDKAKALELLHKALEKFNSHEA